MEGVFTLVQGYYDSFRSLWTQQWLFGARRKQLCRGPPKMRPLCRACTVCSRYKCDLTRACIVVVNQPACPAASCMSSPRGAKQHAAQMLRRCLQVLLKAPFSLSRVEENNLQHSQIPPLCPCPTSSRSFSHQLPLGQTLGIIQINPILSAFLPPLLSSFAAVMTATQAEGEESAELNRDAQLGQHGCLQGCVHVCGSARARACVCLYLCICVCARDMDKKLMWQWNADRQTESQVFERSIIMATVLDLTNDLQFICGSVISFLVNFVCNVYK